MSTLQPTEDPLVPSKKDALPKPQTGAVVAAIRALLSGETIVDANDRRSIADAVAFLDAPTHNLPDLARHASSIGELMAYGLSDPSVDALNMHLQMLLCVHHIAAAEQGLAQVPPDLEGVRHSVTCALDFSSSYFKDNNDDSFLNQARALQARLEQL